VTTTHALLAGKVQHKVRNGVAQLAAAGSSLDRQKFLQWRRCASMNERPRKNAAEILALGPSCVSRSAAAQTRIVSVAGIRLDSRNLCDLSKG
jgi:hypothetical protein